jgi:ankyrin repeat protein
MQVGLNGNALQAAAKYGHEEIVRLLLDHGAEVNAKGQQYHFSRITSPIVKHFGSLSRRVAMGSRSFFSNMAPTSTSQLHLVGVPVWRL